MIKYLLIELFFQELLYIMNNKIKTAVILAVTASIVSCSTTVLAARKLPITNRKPSTSATTKKLTSKVTFADKQGTISEEEVEIGSFPKNTPETDLEGKEIIAWVTNGKKIYNPDTYPIESDTVFTTWESAEAKETHVAYISTQYPKFRPGDYFTKAELCSVLGKIYNLPDNGLNSEFEDISSEMWYAGYVASAAASGIIEPKEDGIFAPDEYVTRAEIIYTLCSNMPVEETETVFSDTEGHKAQNHISLAYNMGWINGDENGLFRPDDKVTRAEAVSMINRAINRGGDKNKIKANHIMPFCDVKASDWFYGDIMEASVPHSHIYGEDGKEYWQNFDFPTTGHKNNLVPIDGVLYFTDNNGQFVYHPANTFVNSGNSTYYTNEMGTVNTAVRGPVNIDGQMYCFAEDHSIIKNGYYGKLFFGADGRYTCTDADLDALVDEALSKCTTANMQRWEKLRASYLYLRDNCKYLSRPHHPRGTDSFVHESASFMFKNNRGNCYCYASCFLLMAHRLGYHDAYIVSGGVGTKNDDHAWVMINGKIFDPELEYAHMYRYKNKKHYNLYDMDISKTPFPYHFPK